MKVEEKHGFNNALEIDNQVWKVLPKIQARMIKSMLKLNDGTKSLFNGLKTKLELDGFKFKANMNKNGFRITITKCPWHKLMIKSGREKLSGIIGSTICGIEYPIWISEFGAKMLFKLKNQKCKDSESCIFEFNKT